MVKIFSDCKEFHETPNDGRYCSKSTTHYKMKRMILEGIINSAWDLRRDSVGVRTSLEFHRVSAHTGLIDAHTVMDWAAGLARKIETTWAICHGMRILPSRNVHDKSSIQKRNRQDPG